MPKPKAPKHEIAFAEMTPIRSIFTATTIGGHRVAGVVETEKGHGKTWTAISGDEQLGTATAATKDQAVLLMCNEADELLGAS